MINLYDSIKELKQKLPDECLEIANYDNGYVSDSITEIADSGVDVYNGQLLDWLKNDRDSVDYIEEYVAEFGVDTRNFDFWQLLRGGQFYAVEHTLHENKTDMLLYFALVYITDKKELNELSNELYEQITDLDYDNYDKLEEIINDVDEILGDDNAE